MRLKIYAVPRAGPMMSLSKLCADNIALAEAGLHALFLGINDIGLGLRAQGAKQ